MKRRTERAKARKVKRSSKHVPQTSKYAEKKRLQFTPIRDSQNWYDKP